MIGQRPCQPGSWIRDAEGQIQDWTPKITLFMLNTQLQKSLHFDLSLFIDQKHNKKNNNSNLYTFLSILIWKKRFKKGSDPQPYV